MGVAEIIGAIGPVAKALLKGLELIDPKTRDWVRKRKALEWAEKYILVNEELRLLLVKESLSKKEKVLKRRLERKLRYLKRYFFAYD